MMRRFGQNGMCALVLLLAVLWGGCQTSSDSATPQAATSSVNDPAAQAAAASSTNSVFSIDRIAVGDVIRVMYEASVPITPTEIQVPETGLVTIHMGEQVQKG